MAEGGQHHFRPAHHGLRGPAAPGHKGAGRQVREINRTGKQKLFAIQVHNLRLRHCRLSCDGIFKWAALFRASRSPRRASRRITSTERYDLTLMEITSHCINISFRIWDFSLDDSDMKKMSDLNVGWRHLIWAETSAHAVSFGTTVVKTGH